MASAVTLGIPTPAFSTALAFFDGYRSARLPANLIQVKQSRFLAIKQFLFYQFLVEARIESFQTNLIQEFSFSKMIVTNDFECYYCDFLFLTFFKNK